MNMSKFLEKLGKKEIKTKAFPEDWLVENKIFLSFPISKNC